MFWGGDWKNMPHKPWTPTDTHITAGVFGFFVGWPVGGLIAASVEHQARELDADGCKGDALRAVSGAIGAATAGVAISYPLVGWGFFFTSAFATGGIIVAAAAVAGIMGCRQFPGIWDD